jgi:dienelactone hydrolase
MRPVFAVVLVAPPAQPRSQCYMVLRLACYRTNCSRLVRRFKGVDPCLVPIVGGLYGFRLLTSKGFMKANRACLLIALTVLFVPNSVEPQIPARRFEVVPSEALMDEVVRITVQGLIPGELITIRARTTAADKRMWQSQASFRANVLGNVVVATQAPVSGTYNSVDAMGLFWSMSAASEQKEGNADFLSVGDPRAPIMTRIEAESHGRVFATVDVRRWFQPETVRVTDVRDAGLAARFYEPVTGGRHPGLILLGGSEGGYDQRDAPLYAARGYCAMSLAYFGLPGLPATLQNVPLECVKRAIDWMRACPSVEIDRIGIIGGSRGSELALLAATRFPELRAVVVMKPSHVVWEGLNARGYPDGAPFTYQSKPLTYVPNHITLGLAWQYVTHAFGGPPPPLAPMFLHDLGDREAVGKATIPVERINGPVLLLSGKDDQLWPSALMSDKVIERLKQHGHPFRDEHVAYDGVGHFIPTSYLPTAGSRRGLKFAIGGSPQPTARASPDAWHRILAFLQAALADGARP